MTLFSASPFDDALAELGAIVRRARSDSLTPVEFSDRAQRLGLALAAEDVDPRRHLRALLDMLVQAAEREAEGGDPVNPRQWDAITGRLRIELLAARARAEPERPNFYVLPSGVPGRPQPVLTVFDGGRP